MHLVKVVITGIGETVVLRYRSQEDADAISADLNEFKDASYHETTPVSRQYADDFGHKVTISRYTVALVSLLDSDKSLEADFIIEFDKRRIHDKVQAALLAAPKLLTPVGLGPNGARIIS